MYRTAQWLGGFGAGALAMYLLDPNRGHRRRAIARDKFTHAVREARDAVDVTSRDVAHRLQGVAAEARNLFDNTPVDDDVLVARVRSRLGRIVSRPGSLEVSARNGQITLAGKLSPTEAERVRAEVRGMRGASGLIDRLDLDPRAVSRSVREFEFLQQSWSPAARAVAIVIGGGFAGYGTFNSGIFWKLLAGAGFPFFLRGLTNMQVPKLLTLDFGRFETQKHPEKHATKHPARQSRRTRAEKPESRVPSIEEGWRGESDMPEPLVESGPLLSEKPHIASGYGRGKAG